MLKIPFNRLSRDKEAKTHIDITWLVYSITPCEIHCHYMDHVHKVYGRIT